jgi:triosephosphate isomerase (TIM)
MRRPVIAGNWKMYKTVRETVQFIEEFKPLVQNWNHCDIVIAPPFTALAEAVRAVRETPIGISAQDVCWESEGAYTGAISGSMLVDVGCRYTIIGHSERRRYFGENDETVHKKIGAALRAHLVPIVCLGELLAEREAGLTQKVIQAQYHQGLAGLTGEDFSRIILAYEPVWAIGTGRTATPEFAEQVHQFIRERVQEQYGEGVAQGLRILYGGSVKPENVKGLLAQADIDGALVGGASLKASSFASIVNYW